MSAESTKGFIAGYASGVAGLLVGSPLDVIKVRIQTKGASSKSSLGILRNIVREEGATALFKGITSPIIGLAALNSILFVSYGEILRLLAPLQKPPTPDLPSPFSHVLAAGFGAGIACFIASTPTELIKCRMQVLRTGSQRSLSRPPFGTALQKPSLLKITSEIFRTSGFRGLYKGGAVTICRDAPGYMVYFGTYETLVRGIDRFRGDRNTDIDQGMWDWTDAFTYLFAGGVAGCASWASVYPLGVSLARITKDLFFFCQDVLSKMTDPLLTSDVLKSRIQTHDLMIESNGSEKPPQNPIATNTRPPPVPAQSTFAFAKSIYQTEGLRVFTRGLAPTMFRAFPVNAVTFLVFEGIKALWV